MRLVCNTYNLPEKKVTVSLRIPRRSFDHLVHLVPSTKAFTPSFNRRNHLPASVLPHALLRIMRQSPSIFLDTPRPMFLLSSGVALTPNSSPTNGNLLRAGMPLPYVPRNCRTVYPTSGHRRPNALGVCVYKHDGVRYGTVVVLPCPPI